MEPLEKMRQAVRQLTHIQENEWAAFAEKVRFQVFNKESFLCREGEVERSIFFLTKGSTRNFFIKDGKEFTINFHFEGEFVTSYYSFLTRQPSTVFIEAMEDVETCVIQQEWLYQFYDQYKTGERIGRLMAEHQYIARLQREIELLSLSAEERYARLIQRNPHLVHHISVKHLASYLGVQPESLSRIRARYTKN